MKKNFVSLGGGCDVATNLKKLGLRQKAYPFDWLWNLDAGLIDVVEIISSNFEKIRNKEDYIYANHRISKQNDSILVFKEYPDIAHIHSNPLENTATLVDFNSRIDGLSRELNNINTKTVFIYYRNLDNEQLWNEGGCFSSIDLLVEESRKFEYLMKNAYPRKNFTLVSLIAIPTHLFNCTNFLHNLRKYCSSKTLPKTTLEVVPLRDDRYPEQYTNWRRHWYQALRRAKAITFYDCYLARTRKKLKKLKKSKQKLVPS